ncbi:MAG: trehalase family glycosidase [Gemmatimonadaceae bacterium]
MFSLAPRLRCSDPYFERYYRYRWYGLWLNALDGGVGNYDAPSMCEGIGFFHQPITYSGQCHVRELRWLSDPTWAQGVLRSFFRHQRPDGSLHGRVYVNHLAGTDFYHANWGDALLALDAVWPDDALIAELYPALALHSDWLANTRDADRSGMIDVVDQYETGQEYMSRYQAVDAQADSYGWENRIRLKGIDVTVYAYALASALERLAVRAGAADDTPKWRLRAESIADAVRRVMWNPSSGMFSDVDPRSGERTGVAAAVCFYPYFTDLALPEHLDGLRQNLLDPRRFWTQYPVPSSALDDPLFNAEAEWKGKRHVCPWNGRVWPMTNSHIVEALGRWATPDRPDLRDALVRLVHQYVRMMFHDGDLSRPNCYEHYNPFTGHASEYRGIDDYQHSWVADLLIQYLAGVRPTAQGVRFDPFPFGVDMVELTGVTIRGHAIEVRVEGPRYAVTVDGERHERSVGEELVIDF